MSFKSPLPDDFKKILTDYSYNDFVNRHNDYPGFWKYLPLLPINSPNSIIDLGELITPLIKINVTKFPKNSKIFVKDEGRLPTGSFKARGLALAVAKAKEFGIHTRFIELAGEINSSMPKYVVNNVSNALNNICKSVKLDARTRMLIRVAASHLIVFGFCWCSISS